MSEARGKTLKVVAPLLSFLPAGESYRVIFVERDLDEIIASQNKMIQHRGTTGATLSSDKLRQVFEQQLTSIRHAIAQRDDTEVLFVDYRRCVESPEQVASAISDFLGLDDGAPRENMAAAVDPALYRNRSSVTR